MSQKTALLASAECLQIHGKYARLFGKRHVDLRYGENPSQKAVWFKCLGAGSDRLALHKFQIVGGEAPSYINMTDFDRLLTTAVRLASGLEQNGMGALFMALAVKHGNVCGVGVADSPSSALGRMIESDPTSLFGGCVLVNFPIDEELAETLRAMEGKPDRPLDMVIAPGFTSGAWGRLSRKNGKCRICQNPALGTLSSRDLESTVHLRQIRGGFLLQGSNQFVLKIQDEWGDVLSEGQKRDLVIAWALSATSDSNTIVLVSNGQLLGRGIAQPSRVFACKVAVMHARENGHDERLQDAVAVSDSFFPAADGPTVLAAAGVKVIFATSGSVKDVQVAGVCKSLGVTLLQLPDKEARGFFGH